MRTLKKAGEKKMGNERTVHVILCVGQRGEVLFNRRRVSRDAAVLEQIAAEPNLTVSSYSWKLFSEMESRPVMNVSYTPLADTPDGGTCFIEDTLDELQTLGGRVKRLTIYRWDKTYPKEKLFVVEDFLHNQGKSVEECATELTKFPGKSHEEIMKEEYEL